MRGFIASNFSARSRGHQMFWFPILATSNVWMRNFGIVKFWCWILVASNVWMLDLIDFKCLDAGCLWHQMFFCWVCVELFITEIVKYVLSIGFIKYLDAGSRWHQMFRCWILVSTNAWMLVADIWDVTKQEEVQPTVAVVGKLSDSDNLTNLIKSSGKIKPN